MIRRGFTLVELIIVLLIIVVLCAIVFPWVQSQGRTPARRMQCGNNIKQLCLGLVNYHDIFLSLPSGAQHRTFDDGPPSFGPSWIVTTLPFCEQRPLYEKLNRVQQENSPNDYQNAAVRQVADKQIIRYLLCPASTLPDREILSGFELVVPHYAGIMGANRVPTGLKTDALDPITRLAAGPYGGVAAANGMLPINEWLSMSDCSDGTANVILVGEVSDWYFNDSGQKLNPSLSVANAGEGAHAGAGWIAGTDLGFQVVAGGSAIPPARVFNLITIEHPIGINNRAGRIDSHPNWGAQGIGRCGLNNPLTSAHPAGAQGGFLDGHISLLTKQTDVYVLRRLAIRSDGGVASDEY